MQDWFKSLDQLSRVTISWVGFRCEAFKLIKINQKTARAPYQHFIKNVSYPWKEHLFQQTTEF